MPQAHNTLFLIHFWSWEKSLSSLLVLWGNKNWPPSIKMKEMENSKNKMQLMGYKWPSLNAQGIQDPTCHSFLEFGDFPFLTISPLPENWPPRIKMKQTETSMNKMGLMGCKWSSLNATGTHNPLCHPIPELGDFPFLATLWGNKNWPPNIKIKQMGNSKNKIGLMAPNSPV